MPKIRPRPRKGNINHHVWVRSKGYVLPIKLHFPCFKVVYDSDTNIRILRADCIGDDVITAPPSKRVNIPIKVKGTYYVAKFPDMLIITLDRAEREGEIRRTSTVYVPAKAKKVEVDEFRRSVTIYSDERSRVRRLIDLGKTFTLIVSHPETNVVKFTVLNKDSFKEFVSKVKEFYQKSGGFVGL